MLVGVGLPADEATGLTELFTRHLRRPQRAHQPTASSAPSGDRPRDFRDYARSAAATGIWAMREAS